MNTRQLRYFIAVSKNLNFTKAAKELYVTQPTISNQIHELEHEIGLPLFKRAYHQVSLTTAGRLLVPVATEMIAQEDHYFNMIDSLKGLHSSSLKGTLKIGLYMHQSDNIMVRLIKDFKTAFPQVKILVDNLAGDELRSGLLENGYDLAFGMIKPMANIKWQFIYHDHFVAVMAAKVNPHRKTISVEELNKKQLINLPLSGLTDYQKMQSKIVNIDNQIEVHSTEAGLSNLELLNSYMLLPSSICQSFGERIHQLEVTGVKSNLLRFDVGIAYDPKNSNRLVPIFCEFVKNLSTLHQHK